MTKVLTEDEREALYEATVEAAAGAWKIAAVEFDEDYTSFPLRDRA